MLNSTAPQLTAPGQFAVCAPIPAAWTVSGEIVVIDTAAADWETLRDAAAPVAQVLVVGAGQDGLALLADALATREPQSGPVTAIHLIGHGEPGVQNLGAAVLDAAALDARADLVATIGAALGGNGALFLHGCAVGAGPSGNWLLAGLAALTGANVAAARQPVGNGHWQLDNVAGDLPDSAAMDRLAASGFSGLLADKPVLAGGKTDLTYLSNVNDEDNNIPDLDDPSALTMSADGKFVYVSGEYTDGILVFARDASTGALTFVSQAKNGTGGLAGLTEPTEITISPDGKSVYVVDYDGEGDSGIYVFSRNATTGALTYSSKVVSGLNGVSGLTDPRGLAVSPDGKSLYVTGNEDNAIVTFTRDTTTGNLTFAGKLVDDVGGVEALGSPEDVVVSPDGKSVYVAAYGNDSVAMFSRNTTTGALTFVGYLQDDSDGIEYLYSPRGVTVSPDGKFVYVAAEDDDAINIFSRDANTSALTYVGAVVDGEGGVTGMEGPLKLTITPDGKSLLVVAVDNDALVVFDRNTTTGALTFAEALYDNEGNIDGLNYPSQVIVSPDGKHAYVVALNDDAVSAFSIGTGLFKANFTEDAGAVALVPDAVLTDVDSTNLKRATISLALTPDGAAESLSATGLPGGITASYNAGTRTLTLSGTASVADYQAALRLVKYNNTSNAPTAMDRSFTISVTDSGDLSSDAVAGTLSVVSANDAPTLTATAITDAKAAAGSGTAISLFRDTAISTVEAGQGVNSLALTVAGVTDGTKEFLTINGSDVALTDGTALTTGGYSYAVTLSSGTATVTVTPTSSATTSTIASLVDGITYKNTGSATGTRTVTITSLQDDGGTANGGQDTATLSVTNTLTLTKVAPTVTDPVVGGVTVTPPMPVYTEDGNAMAVVPSATLGDVDSTNLKRVTVTLTATPDGTAESLSATDLPGGITAAYDATTRTLTLSGTASVAHYQEALRLVKYANINNEPTTTNRQFTIVATDTDDLSSTGYTGNLSVVAANDAPTLTATANSAAKALAGSGFAVSLFQDTAISTVEAGQSLSRVALSVAGVTDGAKEFLTINGTDVALTDGNSFTANGYSFSVGLNSGTATVTVTPSTALSATAVASLVNGITYKNIGEDGGHRTVTITGLTDNGGTANGGHDTASLSVATTVTLMDNPVVSNAGAATVSYRGNLQTSSFIADALGMSPDGKSVYAASSEGVLEVYSRNTDTGTLTFVSSLRQDEENPNGVNGLINATAIAVSTDGKSAYVASFDGKIALFNRDTGTGALTYVSFVMNGQNGVSGISKPISITSSSDDKFVYVAGNDGNLVTFSRNTTNGSLTYVGKLQDGVGGVDGLSGANSVELSPDGTSLYVTGSSDNAVAFFSRDISTGALTYGGAIKDGVGGADGLNQPQDVVVSPDGKFAYVTSSGDDAISIFSRNASTGALAYVGVVRNGENGVSGLDGAHKLVVTPDGTSVLAAGILDSSLVQFERNPTTGALTFVKKLVDGVDGVDKLLSPGPVLVSPDGKSAYVASGTSAFLTAFSIDQTASVAAYTEDGGAVALLPGAVISDVDSTALKRITVTLTTAPDGAAETLSATDLPGGITAAYDASTRTLTLSGNASVANYQAALRLVKYANSSNEPTTTDRSFTVTVTDADDLSSDALNASLTVTAANDAPTLTATADPEAKATAGSGAAIDLFDDAAISTVEAGQGLKGLTLTVGGVTDGAKEFLTINGSDIALTNGNTPTANGYSYAVTLTDGTATVTATASSSATAGTMASLVDAITYKNTGAESGTRTVTVTGLTDDGGTAHGGHDTASLTVSNIVTLMAKPALTAAGLTLPTYAGSLVNANGPVTGLAAPTAMTVSADGKSVYAITDTGNLVVFNRSSDTGALTYVGTLENGVGGVSGLLAPTSVTVSGDGKSVYVTSGSGHAVAIFTRNTDTGALTYVDKVENGVGGVVGLSSPASVTVSPDGKSVYALGQQGDAIVIFSRDAITGTLTYVGSVQDGVNGVTGLDFASQMTLSADGKFAYVTSRADDSVTWFSRDSATGNLTYVGQVQDGVSGVDGLSNATGIAMSADGKSVYVTGRSEVNSIVVFARNAETGALTFVDAIHNGDDGINDLFGSSPVTVTPDGSLAYVAASGSSAVLVFARNTTTGALTYLDKLVDGGNGGEKLGGAKAVIVSPDGKSVYVASSGDNALTVFTSPQLTFTEDGNATVLVPDAVLADVDSANLKRITVTLAATPDGAAEGLSATDLPGGITAAYDPATRTLTLSGTANVADYQAALRLVKYANSSNAPTTTERTFTITVTDAQDNSSATTTGRLTLTAVNDAPTLTAPSDITLTDTAAADNFTGQTGTLAASDPDSSSLTYGISTGQSSSHTASGITYNLSKAGTYGTLYLNSSTGAYLYIPNTSAIQVLKTAQTDSFTLNVTDGVIATPVSQTLTVRVNGTDDAPVITSNTTVSVLEGATNVTTVTATDVEGDSVSYSIAGGADEARFTINATTGVLSFITAPDFENKADSDQDGIYQVMVRASDGQQSSTQTVAVTIANINDAPTLASTANPSASFEANSGDPSTRLFSATSVSTVEPGQLLTRLILTVGGVKNGAQEMVTIGGQTVTLINGASASGAGRPAMAVTIDGETATVTVEFGQGISPTDLASLVDGMTYANQEPTASGGRTITLTALRDSGGTADGGRDTTSLTIATNVTIRPDTTPPDTPSITSGTLTNDATPIITGTAEAGSAVGISVAGAQYNVRTDGDGRWSLDLGNARPNGGALALNTDGTNAVSVTATDAAGNTSPAATQVLTVDTRAPTITGASFVNPQMQLGATGNVAFTIGGGEVGATYNWTITSSNGASRSGTGVMDGLDARITGIDLSGFAEGPLTLSVTLTDPAGNTSPVSTGTGTIVKAMSWPINPEPQALIDGATVTGSTSTRPDGTITTSVVIEAPTAGRQDDPTTPNSSTADVPVVREQVIDPQTGQLETVTTLMIGVPTGVSVTSSGPGGRADRGRSLTDLIREIEARTDANDSARTDLSDGGSDFLSSLASSSMLLVRSIDIGGEGGSTSITGSSPVASQPIALVVDSTEARGPVTIQLDNVAFAAVIGGATIVGGAGSQVVHGDNASQTMILGPGDDELHGGGGNDTVASTLGNDLLFGDAGDDLVHGGAGDDWVLGGADNDLIGGGDGNDRGFGGSGNDTLFGEDGDDVLTGEAGNDMMDGGAGTDTLFGGDGDDWLYGNSGADTLSAGTGNDISLGGDGDDLIGLGDGNDLGAGGNGNDTLFGEAGNDTLMGGAGDDMIQGGDGDDLIFADGGKDTIWGGDGRDSFALGATSGGTILADFEIGKDRLALYDASLDLGTIIATARTVDGNTLLDLGGGQIVTIIGRTGDVASWFLDPAGA